MYRITDTFTVDEKAAASYKATGAKGKVVVGGSSSVSPVMEKLVEAYSKGKYKTYTGRRSDRADSVQQVFLLQ